MILNLFPIINQIEEKAMVNNEKLFKELKAKDLTEKLPNHEIEELLGIGLDDFDATRDGPDTPRGDYYKNFSCEQAGKNKILAERLMRAGDLNSKFVFWRIAFPAKLLLAMLLFSATSAASFFLWLLFWHKGQLYSASYCLIMAVSYVCIVWLLNRCKFFFFGVNPKTYYETRRKKDFADVSILSSFNLDNSLSVK